MAEKTTQTQTTAATAAPSTPAAAAAPDATPRAPTVLSADPFRAAMAKAFAAEASDDEKAGEQRTPDESGDTETNETTEGADEAETSTVEETGEEAKPEVPAEDPNGNPDEITVDSELPESPEEMKGFENLLPWQVKRFKRLLRVNREKSEKLATAGVPVIQPTPLSPLADVETLPDLEQRINDARSVKEWCLKHAEGHEYERNGKTIEITAEKVARKLAEAEAEIEAYADVKVTLHERERTQPAKAALQLVPDLLKPQSESNNIMLSFLQLVPEAKTRVANWEEVQAYLVLGFKQAQKLKQGVQFVEVKPEEKGAPAAQAKPKPKPVPSPSGDKPTLQAKGAPVSVSDAMKALPANATDAQRARTALAAALSSAA
jgi:hypothetical protein